MAIILEKRMIPKPYDLCRMPALRTTLLILGFIFISSSLFPESIPTAPEFEERDLEGRVNAWRHTKEADGAMTLGLYNIAADLYESALSITDDARHARNIRLKMIDALLNNRQLDRVKEILFELAAEPDAQYYIRKALWALENRQLAVADAAINACEHNELPNNELSWYYLAKASIAERKGNYDAALELYAKAKQNASDSRMSIHVETYMMRNKLLHANVDETTLEELKEKMDQYAGGSTGFTFAREYARALYRLDRTEEAVRILEQQLTMARNLNSPDGSSLQLLMALISGIETQRSHLALTDLIINESDIRLRRLALYYLVKGMQEAGRTAELNQQLDNFQENEDDDISDDLHFYSASIALKLGNPEAATAKIERMLELYPGSDKRVQAYELLASISLSRDPPQYRTAAANLTEMRKFIEEPTHRARIGMLIADCYFINEDYDNANKFYKTVLAESPNHPLSGRLLYQLVISLIRSGDIDGAAEQLNNASPNLDSLERWKAEWNLLYTLQQSGEGESALKRISSITRNNRASKLPNDFLLRIKWMEANLALEGQDAGNVPALTDVILGQLNRIGPDGISNEDRALITSQTLLLKARALMKTSQPEQALETYNELRSRFDGSTPALTSFLDEARYYTLQGKSTEALQILLVLADKYPESEHSPIALYEAALNAEAQGLQRTYDQGVTILQRIIDSYPHHGLAFYARNKQGDLLRRLNRFGAAQTRYEDLLRRYPEHPEKNGVELSIAQCLLARSAEDKSRTDQAVAMLERLFDLPKLPNSIHLEAGFLLAQTILKQEQKQEAMNLLWQIISRYKNSLEEQNGQAQGGYWVSRAVFELARVLEEDGNTATVPDLYRIIIKLGLPGRKTAEERLLRYESPRSDAEVQKNP